MNIVPTQVATSNLLEVLYLLDVCHHRIVAVGQQSTWPYGIEELSVTLEGEGIDLDHQNYLRHGSVDFQKLPTAFEAIAAMMATQASEAHS